MNREVHTPGPCKWNGNEIQDARGRGVAGIAPDAPEEWGPLFAAAPEMLETLRSAYDTLRMAMFAGIAEGSSPEFIADCLENHVTLKRIRAAIAKAEGR